MMNYRRRMLYIPVPALLPPPTTTSACVHARTRVPAAKLCDNCVQVLHGNIARDSALLKLSGKVIGVFKGPARVFDREKDAFDAVMEGGIKKGDVMVIRYEVGCCGGV